jgi:hypothetical protein
MQISENVETGLKRALGPFHLITLGIGAIIGAGATAGILFRWTP